MTKAEKLINEALTFPVEIRARVIEQLLKSLNPVHGEMDAAWAKEAEKRLAQIKTGREKAIPARAVFDRLTARLK